MYFILYRELIANEVYITSNILANNAFIYSLISIDYTEPSIVTLLLDSKADFSAYISKTTSRYSKEVFIGIIVNIGTSRKSTAGYSQFKAL
jgi:hypothetical protein